MRISKITVVIIGFVVLTSYSNQWEVFTSKNNVRDIALAGNTLWAATTGGVFAWNLDNDSYKSYTTLDGLLSCDINHVAIDKKGRPWVATKDPTGLFVYENHTWKQIKVDSTDNEMKDKNISGLEVDQFGNVWVYTRYVYRERDYINDIRYGYLWRYDGQTWYKHKGVYGPIALDSQKNLLAVDSLVHNNSYRKYQIKIASFNGSEFVSKYSSKTHRHVHWIVLAHIAQDSNGNLWISYYGHRHSRETYGVMCNNTIYNTQDGLADNNVRSITADKSGTVWCATDGGISKFTGKGWVTYDTTKGVASNLVYRILSGRNNTLYAATSKGISILKSNQWKTLKTANEPLNNNYTDIIVDKRDAVILSGGDHIAIYNDLQWRLNYFRNIRVSDFIKSNDGTLYVIGNWRRVKGYILKQGTEGNTFFITFSYTFDRYNQFWSPAVTSSNNDSCFWLTDIRGNLFLVKKQKTAIFPPSGFGVRGKPGITCMLLDCDGRSVWVGYMAYDDDVGGIVHFDGDAVKKRINENNGLASDWVSAIVRDSSKNLWFASRTINKNKIGGIAVLRNTKLTKYLKDSNGKVFGGCNTLFVDKSGFVWTHSDSGIARFDGNSWKLFEKAAVSPNLPYARYSHIIQDKSGMVWFGTKGSGLLAYKDNKWYQFTTRDGIPSNSILGCALDSKDNLWILTDNGIAMHKSDGTVHNRARHDLLILRKNR